MVNDFERGEGGGLSVSYSSLPLKGLWVTCVCCSDGE